MISINIKLHKIAAPKEVALKPNGEFDKLVVEKNSCLSNLTHILKVPDTGFVILVNGIAVRDPDMQLRDNDSIEIFRLHAGG